MDVGRKNRQIDRVGIAQGGHSRRFAFARLGSAPDLAVKQQNFPEAPIAAGKFFAVGAHGFHASIVGKLLFRQNKSIQPLIRRVFVPPNTKTSRLSLLIISR